MASTVPLNVILVSLLLIICFILSLVGLLINPWLTGTTLAVTSASSVPVSVDRTLGLWKNCVADNCQSVFDYLDQQCQDPLPSFRACQALLIIAVISFFLAAILIVVARYLLNQPLMGLGGCLTGLAFACCLIVILVWKFAIQDKTFDCNGTTYVGTIKSVLFPSSSLAAGWILVLIATILSLFAFLFTFWFCIAGSARGPKPPPKFLNDPYGYQRFDNGQSSQQYYPSGRTYTNAQYYNNGSPTRYPAPAYSVNQQQSAYADPYGNRTAYGQPSYAQPAYSQPAIAAPPAYAPAPVATSYSPPASPRPSTVVAQPYASPGAYGAPGDEHLLQRCQMVRAKLINTLADDASRNLRR